MSLKPADLEARIKELEEKLGQSQPQYVSSKCVWCVETGRKFTSIRIAAKETDISVTQLSNAAHRRNLVRTAGGYHWSFVEPKPQTMAMANLIRLAETLVFPVMSNQMDDKTRINLSNMAKLIAAALAILFLAMPVCASITYDVSVDTHSLPATGNYQALFFLIDSSNPDNFSQTKLADGFRIDGDIKTDFTHYYADQPSLDPVPPPIPINFYLTLQGSPGSSDYFLMAIRTPDGGMLTGADGGEWLAWAAMNQDSPTLQFDLPAGMQITSAVVPEPLPVVMILLVGCVTFLMKRPRFGVR